MLLKRYNNTVCNNIKSCLKRVFVLLGITSALTCTPHAGHSRGGEENRLWSLLFKSSCDAVTSFVVIYQPSETSECLQIPLNQSAPLRLPGKRSGKNKFSECMYGCFFFPPPFLFFSSYWITRCTAVVSQCARGRWRIIDLSINRTTCCERGWVSHSRVKEKRWPSVPSFSRSRPPTPPSNYFVSAN